MITRTDLNAWRRITNSKQNALVVALSLLSSLKRPTELVLPKNITHYCAISYSGFGTPSNQRSNQLRMCCSRSTRCQGWPERDNS